MPNEFGQANDLRKKEQFMQSQVLSRLIIIINEGKGFIFFLEKSNGAYNPFIPLMN